MSTINFKFGFSIGKITYGWHEKELYRLPFQSGLRWYGLKKLERKEWGYTVGRKKVGLSRLKELTHYINETVTIIEHSDLPDWV